MRSTKQKVLATLLKQRGQWTSGDELARQFEVSRETIWKAIQTLRKQGIQIRALKNHGYQYEGSQYLHPDIMALLSPELAADQLLVFDQVSSTQLQAKHYLSQHHVTKPVVIIANQQTHGYGRRGRTFYSPSQGGLYITLILPNQHHEWPNEGTLIINTAVIILLTLKQFFPQAALGLKWVNDIYLGTAKVGGIITEADLEMESNTPAAFIMGLGLDLTTAQFPAELKSKVRSIDPQADIDRNQLAATLIKNLLHGKLFQTNPDYLEIYRQKSILTGKQVTLKVGRQDVRGVVKGINETGNIVLRTADNQMRTFSAGEVIKVNWQRDTNLKD